MYFYGLVCKLLSISNSNFSRFTFGKCNLSNLSEIFATGIPISLSLSFSPSLSLFASRPNFIYTANRNSPFISNGKCSGFLFVYACPASCIQQQQQQKRIIWPELQRDPMDNSLEPIHFFLFVFFFVFVQTAIENISIQFNWIPNGWAFIL